MKAKFWSGMFFGSAISMIAVGVTGHWIFLLVLILPSGLMWARNGMKI